MSVFFSLSLFFFFLFVMCSKNNSKAFYLFFSLMSHPGAIQERNQDATVYVGELDHQVTESILWELMVQCGPVGESTLFY
jgi:hypothetical protein